MIIKFILCLRNIIIFFADTEICCYEVATIVESCNKCRTIEKVPEKLYCLSVWAKGVLINRSHSSQMIENTGDSHVTN